MFHDDGASTARTGSFVVSKASITFGNGSRTSPEKEKPNVVSQFREGGVGICKPKMESTTRSVSLSEERKSSVKGMSKSFSCFVRRCSRISTGCFKISQQSSWYLIQLVLALLWIVHCWLISVVREMASRHQTITASISLAITGMNGIERYTVISRSACNQYSFSLAG
jgi:hypothetical protein